MPCTHVTDHFSVNFRAVLNALDTGRSKGAQRLPSVIFHLKTRQTRSGAIFSALWTPGALPDAFDVAPLLREAVARESDEQEDHEPHTHGILHGIDDPFHVGEVLLKLSSFSNAGADNLSVRRSIFGVGNLNRVDNKEKCDVRDNHVPSS